MSNKLRYYATAIAHPIQGLTKYHGMRSEDLRIPFHDSISVAEEKLYSKTTVIYDPNLTRDYYFINGVEQDFNKAEGKTPRTIFDHLRRIAGKDIHVFIYSINVARFPEAEETTTKGLGFSSSGGAALAKAGVTLFYDVMHDLEPDSPGTEELLRIKNSQKELSKVARRNSGSAARSLTGSVSRLYAGTSDEDSYSVMLTSAEDLPEWKTIIYPVRKSAPYQTDKAHKEVRTSDYFKSVRLQKIDNTLSSMEAAVKKLATEKSKAEREKAYAKIFELAELDTMSLHMATMDGESHDVLWEGLTVDLMHIIRRLREEEQIPAYYSIDTGPAVFVNTTEEYTDIVKRRVEKDLREVFDYKENRINEIKPVVTGVGGPAELVERPVDEALEKFNKIIRS